MSRFPRIVFLPWLVAVTLLFSVPAGAMQFPEVPDPNAISQVDTITILPVIYSEHQSEEDMEERMDSLYGKLDDYIYKALLRKLSLKGYVLDKPRRWKRPDNWTVEALKPLSSKELAQMAPASASYAAYLFIEHLQYDNQVVESGASAVVSVVILQCDSGEVVWQNSRIGEFRENFFVILATGGLGMLLTPDKHAAIENAFKTLFDDFPEKQY